MIAIALGSWIAGGDAPADRPDRNADTAIRRRVLDRLAQHAGWRAEVSNVFVTDGVAILQGLFDRDDARRAALAVARSVPGVRAVRDARVPARVWQSLG